MMMKRVTCSIALLVLSACLGSTGGRRTTFAAYASGPSDARQGEPLRFSVVANQKTFEVALDTARVRVQAIYLNRSISSGTQRADSCYEAENYVGEVRADLDIDAMDPAPQAFPGLGSALETPARAADLWLGAGPINEFSQESNQAVVFAASGSVRRGSLDIPFRLAFKIDLNRKRAPQSSALPGTNQICELRIVDQIRVGFTPSEGGKLTFRVDPRAWFAGVDFDALASSGEFADGATGESTRVFDNMRQNRGVYSFYFEK
jgi:hypothetical protein